MKNKTEDIRELFVCQCNDPQHQFIIQTIDFDNDPAVYLSVLLTPVGPVWCRCPAVGAPEARKGSL